MAFSRAPAARMWVCARLTGLATTLQCGSYVGERLPGMFSIVWQTSLKWYFALIIVQ